MLKKQIGLVLIFLFANQILLAQKKTKINHVFSIQANQLIRQIFNFSNNNPNINNPYLITYSATNSKTGWGFDVGLGYVYNNIFENDGTQKKQSFINELNARLGFQKNISLTPKFSTQISFHGVIESISNKTQNETSSQGFFQKVTSKTIVKRLGAGPAMGFRYHINSHVSIGTECNYYFKTGNTSTNTTSLSEFQGQPTQFNEVKSDDDLKTFIFNVPTVVFLQIKL
jgi:hypothetical protein